MITKSKSFLFSVMNVAICTNWVVLVHYNVISYCKWISFVGGDSNSKMREKGREGGFKERERVWEGGEMGIWMGERRRKLGIGKKIGWKLVGHRQAIAFCLKRDTT